MTFQIGQSGNPKGRKPIIKKVNRAQLEEITKLYAGGSPEVLIAHELGVSHDTWERLKKRDSRIAEALALGKAQQERFYHRNLMRMAAENNVVANIFPLKAKHSWRENDPPPAEASRITIVQLPAPLTPEAYARTIEAEQPAAPEPALRGPSENPKQR
jgi:hypothetical protein